MPLRGSSFRGFPFEEEDSAWSELAARHPDIAARLRQRASPAAHTPAAGWARKRRPDTHDAHDDFDDDFAGFNRFPFDDIPQEFREHFPTHWNRRFGSREEPPPEPTQQPTQQPPQQPPHSPSQQTAATQTEEKPGPSEQSQIPQYGLRNTVDLGQKSPADPSLVNADERSQRSMSAPPAAAPAPAMSRSPPQEPQPAGAATVRHIPIFVEGRDEPVINRAEFEPKPQFAPPPPPHAEREQYYDDGPSFHAPPNFSRTFGTPFNKGYRQGPQPFVQQKVYPQTAFARGASPQRGQSPRPPADEHFVKVPVQHEPPRSGTPPRQQRPHPPHHQQQQQQPPQQPPPQPQPAPHQPSPPPQTKPQPSANDPITQILSIQTDVLNLMTDVENFTGSKKDKRYMYLDEMLTRNLIKLDNIETDGKENIRLARKEAIRCIQKCIAVLEAKAEKGSSEAQDVEMKEGDASNGDVAPPSEDMHEAKEATIDENKPADDQAVEQPVVEAAPPTESQAPQPPDTRPADVTADPAADVTDPTQANAEQKPADTEAKSHDTDKKSSPKKGAKTTKKRDKSKDKSTVEPSEQNEQKNETMQVDNKGDCKPDSQAMEIDGAASQ